MPSEDIITALRNAVNSGEPLQQAIQVMINSGYNPREVHEASQFVSQGVIPGLGSKPNEHLTMPGPATPKTNQPKPLIQNQQQTQQPQQPIQQQPQQQTSQPIQQQASQLQQLTQPQDLPQQNLQQNQLKEPKKQKIKRKLYLKEIILFIILLLLIGVLITTIIFRESILGFFSGV